MGRWAYGLHALTALAAYWAGLRGGPVPIEPLPERAPLAEAACEVRTVAFGDAEAARALAESVERNVPLRISGWPMAGSRRASMCTLVH